MTKITSLSGLMGVNLKPQHITDFLSETPHPFGWVEVHTENYMALDEGLSLSGAHHLLLERVAEKAPLSFHGIGMSLGGVDDLNPLHLEKTKQLVDHFKPALISEHVAWCQYASHFHNDLLPVPYTHEALSFLTDHIKTMQDYLGRQILVENPSTYIAFKEADFDEADFIMEAVHQSEAGLLLDVNNVIVSAHNQGWQVADYFARLDYDKVGEVHVAGHSDKSLADGTRIKIDDHGSDVRDEIWQALEGVLAKAGPKPVLLERDSNVPSFAALADEARIGQNILNQYASSLKQGKAS